MEYSKNGLLFTEAQEGVRLDAYLDAGGKATIGYGHTGPDIKAGMLCTQEQAEEWLFQDIQTAVDIVNRLVTVNLTQNQFDALVDFTFNLGQSNFAHSTLLADLDAGSFVEAAKQFKFWKYCKGRVLEGLLKRRLGEEALFLTKTV
jgi:lysozyme